MLHLRIINCKFEHRIKNFYSEDKDFNFWIHLDQIDQNGVISSLKHY